MILPLLAHEDASAQPLSVDEAISQLCEYKTQIGCRPLYVARLRRYLRMWSRSCPDRPLAQVLPQDLDRWFAQRHETPASRNSNRGLFLSLFTWARRRRYVVRNPCEALEPCRVDRRPPRILSPEESERLLIHCPWPLLPWLALGLYCGCRPSEIQGLDWSQIDLERGLIRIELTKTRRRRLAPIPEMAALILSTVGQMQGPLCPPYGTLRRLRDALGRAAGLCPWPADILRHTAASYLLARYGDAGRVALWLGHSPAILLTHYYELVNPEDCRRFWGLGSPGSGPGSAALT